MSFNFPRFENILIHSLFSRQKYVSPFKFGENWHSSMLFLQLLVVSKHKKKITVCILHNFKYKPHCGNAFLFSHSGFTFTGLSFIWRNVSVLLHFWRGDPMSNQSFTSGKYAVGCPAVNSVFPNVYVSYLFSLHLEFSHVFFFLTQLIQKLKPLLYQPKFFTLSWIREYFSFLVINFPTPLSPFLSSPLF